MESFLPDSIKMILGAGILGAFVMNRLSYAFPHMEWLRYFRLPAPDISEKEKERRRRGDNRRVAFEMAGLALVLPLLYVGSTIIFFNEPDSLVLRVLCAISVALIGVSVWLFVKNL